MKLIEEDSLASIIALLTVFNLLTIANPFFVHLATKRYAIEMHYYPKEKKYSATIYTLFLKHKTVFMFLMLLLFIY